MENIKSKVYITGDTHARILDRLNTRWFGAGSSLTRDDIVIICGDFGGIWNHGEPSEEEKYILKWLKEKNFTVVFCDGNHENFDRLNAYPVVEWHGGKAHQISENVFHLMRGEIYNINDKKFFVFGGAHSHDIQDGILDPEEYGGFDSDSFKKEYRRRIWREQQFRVKGYSWWPQEVPTEDEKSYALANLAANNNNVDFIISHEGPAEDIAILSNGRYDINDISKFLQKIKDIVTYEHWYFGHHHLNEALSNKDTVLYHDIIQIM